MIRPRQRNIKSIDGLPLDSIRQNDSGVSACAERETILVRFLTTPLSNLEFRVRKT
jgi:hypothetical protein